MYSSGYGCINCVFRCLNWLLAQKEDASDIKKKYFKGKTVLMTLLEMLLISCAEEHKGKFLNPTAAAQNNSFNLLWRFG